MEQFERCEGCLCTFPNLFKFRIVLHFEVGMLNGVGGVE